LSEHMVHFAASPDTATWIFCVIYFNAVSLQRQNRRIYTEFKNCRNDCFFSGLGRLFRIPFFLDTCDIIGVKRQQRSVIAVRADQSGG